MDSPLPTAPWIASQFVPSPEVVVFERGAYAGARWEVTPILFSFGIHRRAPPFRALVVEPILRQSGSVEVFVAPEYLNLPILQSSRLTVRFGERVYFPLISHGEYLSLSLGTSYSSLGRGAVGYELGAYVLFGVLGVQVTTSPSPNAPPFIGTLSIRVF